MKFIAAHRERAGQHLSAIVFFCMIIACWQGAVLIFAPSSLIFPGPLAVVRQLYLGLFTGDFIWHLGVTLYEVVAGFFIGSFLGFTLGVLIEESALLERLLYPYIVAFQTMPKVAIAPLFIVWFGFGVASKIVITAAIAFFPVLANTIAGLRAAPTDQIDLMKAYTASDWQIFRMVRLPQALPFVFTGLDIGIVLAVIGAIVGEFVGSQSGLGYLILQRNYSMDTAGVFAILIVLSSIGIVLHAIVKWIARRVLFWADVPSKVAGA